MSLRSADFSNIQLYWAARRGGLAGRSKEKLPGHVRRAAKNRGRGGGQGIQYLVSLQWPVVQLDFSDGMHMTEKSYMPQSARMRAQIQANTGNFAGQRFSLHGVDLTKFDGTDH